MSQFTDESIDVLMQLAKSESLHGGKFKDFLAELVPLVCRSVSAHKSSFWLYRAEKDEFESIQSFDSEANNSLVGHAIEASAFPEFQQRIRENTFNRFVSKEELQGMEEFSVDYLMHNRLKSWAGMQVWNGNQLFGLLVSEWKANKDFSSQDQLIFLTASSMISQCYDALLKLKEDFLHRNELNTLKIEEKEKEKLANKLSDHAFFTSHNIRHPLSTILALIDLIKLNWESRESYEELLQKLKIETMNLDDAIRVMTAKIELD